MVATSRRRYAAVLASLCVLAGATAATALADPSGSPEAPTAGPAEQIPVEQVSTASGWAQHPLMLRVQGWKTKAIPQLAVRQPAGYSPRQMQDYLHLHGTGNGQTVTIVDAYDNPYLVEDLATYSRQFGLPGPCSTTRPNGDCFNLTVVHPFGFAGVDAGWALEEDLDVQIVHALGPEAAITVVEAHDASLVSQFEAIDYAAAEHPDTISLSWGTTEFATESIADGHCALAQTLCVASTGDAGNPAGYPSTSPYVLAVGGTTLALTGGGQVGLEVGWCCGVNGGAAGTGGGLSKYEARPGYQQAVDSSASRAVPDVSFDADPATGVAVYDTFGVSGQNGWFELGGTSAGAPAWSAIIADADQLRSAAHRPRLAGASFRAFSLLYAEAPAGFGDITVGTDAIGVGG